ncbi:MAG: hypothetical protein ABEJ43_05145 [Haloferacaceae archaeon]
MSDETTQLDLSAELDRLSAMTGDDAADDSDLVLVAYDARLHPDGVAGHELRALCAEGPADLRGQRLGLALHALYDEGVHAERGGERVPIPDLLDAVGGPDLDGYVHDRETGEILAVVDPGDPLTLAVAGSSPVGDAGDERRLGAAELSAATVAGFRSRDRYRRYDAYGRPV